MELFLKAIKNTKLGQSFDNLLTETMKDGFKSKCVVASYFIMFRCSMMCLFLFTAMFFVYVIGIFTDVPVTGDIMIDFMVTTKDLFLTIMGFFAIAVTTTFGASFVETKYPSASTKIGTTPEPPKEG